MGLNQRAKTLIERAAPGLEPTADDRQRNRARIAEKLALTAAAAAAASSAKLLAKGGAGVAAASAKAIGVSKLVAISLLGLGLAGGAVFVAAGHDRPPPSQAPIEAPAHAAPIIEAQVPRVEPSPEAAPVVGATPVPVEAAHRAPESVPPPSASPSGRGSTAPRLPPDLNEEIALLREAQGALSRGESGEAMTLLAEHDRRFPNGKLTEEKAAARIFALCNLGREAEARKAGDAFLGAYPGSTFADRVRASCGGRKSER